MERPLWAETLTGPDIAELCDRAEQALLLKKGKGLARFTWRRRALVAHYTNLRLLVDTAGGKPVACRWA